MARMADISGPFEGAEKLVLLAKVSAVDLRVVYSFDGDDILLCYGRSGWS